MLVGGVQAPSPLAAARSAAPLPMTPGASAEVHAADPKGGNLTLPGTVMGTPPYMSPEQTQGEQIDARTDQYAFGCMLYQMLTGRTPYIGRTGIEIMLQHTDPSKHPIPPRQLAPQLQLSESLEATILRLLAKHPDQRFPSMIEVAQALERELDLLLLASGDRRLLSAEQAQVLTENLPKAALILGGRRMPLWALIPVLCLFAIVAAGLGYRLMATRSTEKPRLQPGELAKLRASAMTVLRSNLAGTAPKELRIAALQALGQSRDGSLSKEIEPLLRDSDALVQMQAAEALGQLAEPSALAALQAGLAQSSQPVVKVALAGALRQLREPSGQRQLTEALRSKNSEVQFNAAMLLCDDSSVPQARKLLHSYMERDQTPEQVRQSILACLAQSGDTQARQKLGEYARGRGPERLDAARRLLQLGDDGGRELLRRTLRQGGPDALMAARILSGPDEPSSVQRLVDVVKNKSSAPPSLLLAAEGLGESGDAFHARLLGRLLAPPADAQLRSTAAASIVRLAAQDPETLSGNSLRWAQGALTNRDWLLRQAAVSVLGDAPSAEAVPLLAQLAKDSDIRIRRSALEALGHRREQAALLVLREGLSETDPQLRRESIHSLGQILSSPPLPGEQTGRSEAMQWLRTYFDHATTSEQTLVSQILAKQGDKTHRDKLHALAASSDPALRRTFAESSTAGTDELERALTDPVFAVRMAAAKRLATDGDHRAVEVLRAALQQGGADAVTAYGLLVRLGEAPGDPAELGPTLTAPEVDKRLAAVTALSTLPAEAALPLLLKAAHDPDAQVRIRAAVVAGRLPSKDGVAAGGPVWQLLLTDRDGAVRARTQALLARSTELPAPIEESTPVDEPAPQPDLGGGHTRSPVDAAVADASSAAAPVGIASPAETPAKSEPDATAEADPEAAADPESGADSAEATALLIIETEPGVLYQLDHRPWQVVGSAPIALTPGTHHLSAMSGQQELTAVAQKTVNVHLDASRAEHLSHVAQESFRHEEYRKAQRQLEQALLLCSQDRKNAVPCAILALDMTFRLGRVRAEQNEWPAAMNEYQKVAVLLHKTKGRSELKGQLDQAMKKLRGAVCKVVVRQRVGHHCAEDTVWVGSETHMIKVGERLEPIEPKAGGELQVGTCK